MPGNIIGLFWCFEKLDAVAFADRQLIAGVQRHGEARPMSVGDPASHVSSTDGKGFELTADG